MMAPLSSRTCCRRFRLHRGPQTDVGLLKAAGLTFEIVSPDVEELTGERVLNLGI